MKQSKKSWKVMAAIVIILSITYTTTLTSNAADLRNGSAFSFKLSDPKGKFNNGATISAHKKAFDTAYAKINASSSRIKLVRSGSGPTIRTRSTSKRDEWYGQMSGNSKGSTITINKYTTTRDKFNQANYNKTALHEMGHAFGMKHQSSSSITVMKQGKYAYNDYTTLDKNNIKYKYGK
ncbi:matrixin family metalloprotease [Listeria monocytogenes]|uniref:matrixin family metalloprotease n=1 Tax=Listeria monocytogenes TaxID=1639 RepID=UPI000E7153FB|nr:matrixin family metalloprotease [Listeria monocytogenes]EBF5128795.1 Xaa-Pro aminopeptidase [Listeria monocytogenes]EDP7542394.1 Xaa-Pro aminopeptidase [Listeria monocytogenes]EDP7814940.1 Xaa-Pro aminopeptidase [Listeria monocytogenes]EJY1255352.1 Xaa-Pro aminopeptidase [Listeria monocytogenes]EMF2333353.1 Xaa-Pro aminopeptidase [Listeria monocytogenes]